MPTEIHHDSPGPPPSRRRPARLVGATGWIGAAAGAVLLLVMLALERERSMQLDWAFAGEGEALAREANDSTAELQQQHSELDQRARAAKNAERTLQGQLRDRRRTAAELTGLAARQEAESRKLAAPGESREELAAKLSQQKKKEKALTAALDAMRQRLSTAMATSRPPRPKPKELPKPTAATPPAKAPPDPPPTAKTEVNPRNLQLALLKREKKQLPSGYYSSYVHSAWEMSAQVRNNDTIHDYHGLVLEVLVFAEYLAQRNTYRVVAKHHRTIDLPRRQMTKVQLTGIRLSQSKENKSGQKYYGYWMALTTPEGKLILDKTNKPLFSRHRAKLLALCLGDSLDGNCDSTEEPRYKHY